MGIEIMARQKENGLLGEVSSYFTTRDANGVKGLVLLDRCIKATAENRDWDGLSRFVTLSARAGHANRVKKIIRAAFGEKLIYKTSKQHATGGTFVMGWDAGAAFPLGNTYSVVSKAIEDKTPWDSVAFAKALSAVLPEPVKPPPAVDQKATVAAAKHLYDYITGKVAAGMAQADLMAAVQKMLKDGGAVVQAKQ
jgi:hypothetical protein